MSIQPEHILLITTASHLIDELRPALPTCTFQQSATFPTLSESLPAVVLIDYSCLPETPMPWQVYQYYGCMILLRFPAESDNWLEYINDHAPDDFLSIAASLAELAYRLKRLLKRHEPSLEETRYKQMFMYHPDAIFLHDLEGHFIDVNMAALHLFGWQRDDLATITISDVVPDDQAEYAHALIDLLSRNEQPRELINFDVRKKDGGYITVEISAALILRDKKPWAVQGVARMVQQKQTHIQLQEAEERYRLLASLTANYTYTYVNVAGKFVREWSDDDGIYQLTGYTHPDVDAKGGWLSLIYEEDVPTYLQHREMVDLGQVAIHDYRLMTSFGGLVWLREYSMPVMKNGILARIYGAVQDISDLKEVQNSENYHRRVIDALHNTALALTSTLDFNLVLDRVLSNLALVIPYDMADVMLVEDQRVRIVRHRGYTEHGLAHIISDLKFRIEEFSTFDRMMQTREPLVIEDVSESVEWVKIFPPEMNCIRSYIGAPLYFAERLVGFLNLNSCHLNYYSPDDAARIAAFASQASIAINNAQLHDDLFKRSIALEHNLSQLMTVQDIGQMLTSTLDLEVLYKLLYEEVALRLLNASQMMILLYNEAKDEFSYTFASENGVLQDPATLYSSPDENKALKRVLSNATSVISADTIYEPLFSRNKVIGILKIVGYKNNHPHEVEITLPIIASLAATAIRNAQLYTEKEQQKDEMTALYRATTVLFEGNTPTDLAQQVTNAVVQVIPQAECALWVISAETQTLTELARSDGASIERSHPIPLSSPRAAIKAVELRDMVYVSDTRQYGHYTFEERAIRSELCIPLISQSGVIGVLYLQSLQVDAFSARDQWILQMLADRVSAALENKQLLQKIQSDVFNLELRVAERTAKLQQTLAKEREVGEIKSRFIQTVSHEFRTPLTAILSAKEMLENYGDRMDIDQRKNRYAIIEQAVGEMVHLIDESLMMHRLADGDEMQNLALVDMYSYTQSVVDDFSRQRGKSHRIVYASVGREAVNLIDSDVWRKVVLELLHNATKFSEPNSEIRCHFMLLDGEFIFSVKDQGIGISPEDLTRVLGTFDRGANAINIAGTGLGLAIVKKIIERQGGRIKIESELGHGTTVTLNLPKYVLEVVP